MHIHLEGSKITCSLKTSLKPHHFSQIKYYGFSFYPEFNGFEGGVENLKKLLLYLSNSNIAFTTSDACRTYIDKIEANDKFFKRIKSVGASIKDGKIDRAELKKHFEFLETNILNRRLKDHQAKALHHLISVQNGANFSVPGSGKTTVVLCAYEKYRLEGSVNVLFVVGPPACFGPWREEFKNVLGRIPKHIVLAGGNKADRKSEYYNSTAPYELYLTSFQTLLNDYNDVAKFFNNKKINSYLVIDEAHYIKQVDGSWASSVLKIAKYAALRCVLTGTPIPRSYTDFYNLFDFLWPDNEPLSANEKAQLSLFEETNDSQSASNLLNKKLGPLFYRVRKKELKLKPQAFNEISDIVMNPLEYKVYEAIVKRISNYSREDYLENIELVNKLRKGRMMRLRQCLSYTRLLETAIDDYSEDLLDDDTSIKSIISKYDEIEKPSKLNRLVKIVDGFQKKSEKVVIWANFIGVIELIEREMAANNWYCKKIIGQTPTERTGIDEEETREKIRDEFVNPQSGLDILIANPAACSESISLHKTCHNAVYYDLSYNCAQYLQSLDRIHRVGGSEKQEAYYYYLQYQDTIEPDILKNLKRKAKKMYQIIDGDFNIYSMNMFENSDETDAYKRLFINNE